MPIGLHDSTLRRTRAYIDLDALRWNYELINARVPGSTTAPAVKANAYGHGLHGVARALQRSGATILCVGTLEECLVLRAAGVTVAILILEELFHDEIEPALESDAVLTVGSIAYARAVDEVAGTLGRRAAVHLNIDTGMGRMGLHARDAQALAQATLAVAALPNLELEGLYSHFTDSDERDKSAPERQEAEFTQVVALVAQHGIRPRHLHIANSGAIIDFPTRGGWNLTRPGIAVYGVLPSPDVDQTLPLRPVLRLVSALVKVTRYERDGTVGYGRTYAVKSGALIGIVPIGYGDGYPRALSNRAHVLIHGLRVPVVGRVSMDMIAVDLSRVSAQARVGDEVVLIGGQSMGPGRMSEHDRAEGDSPSEARVSVEELAQLSDTISYEITCRINDRVPRVFMEGGRAVAMQTMSDGYRELG